MKTQQSIALVLEQNKETAKIIFKRLFKNKDFFFMQASSFASAKSKLKKYSQISQVVTTHEITNIKTIKLEDQLHELLRQEKHPAKILSVMTIDRKHVLVTSKKIIFVPV